MYQILSFLSSPGHSINDVTALYDAELLIIADRLVPV
jgi:hypothetical protein